MVKFLFVSAALVPHRFHTRGAFCPILLQSLASMSWTTSPMMLLGHTCGLTRGVEEVMVRELTD